MFGHDDARWYFSVCQNFRLHNMPDFAGDCKVDTDNPIPIRFQMMKIFLWHQ